MPDNRRAASSVRRISVISLNSRGSRLLQKPGKLSFPQLRWWRAGLARRPSLHRISHPSRGAALELRLGRDRESPPIAERLGGDLDSRRRLLPLVLAALHHPDHPPHQIWIKIMRASDLFSGPRLLHKVFENLIKHFVGRE